MQEIHTKKMATNIKRFKELKACPISLSIPEMQYIPLQQLLSNESATFHKSCKNKFSDLKLGHVEKQQKMSFEKRQNEISSNDSDVTPGNWEMPLVQSLPFLLDKIQMKKMRLQKDILFSGVVKRGIFT